MRHHVDKNNIHKQMQAILDETDNPAIIQDVTDTEFGVIPSDLSDFKNPKHLSAIQRSIVRNSLDGKTWNQLDDPDE